MMGEPVRRRDLVVLGGSAGGVEALREVVAALPADLPAAVLVVLHLPARSESNLAAILNRGGPLPAVTAERGMPLSPGRILVSPPARHLLVRDGRVLLSEAPKQNLARPSIDALFRSAARWQGNRTVAAVLSGNLDDGAVGLAAVDAAGGACLVQDPDDALAPSMPRAALAVVPHAAKMSAGEIGHGIAKLVTESIAPGAVSPGPDLIAKTDMAESNSPIPPPISPADRSR